MPPTDPLTQKLGPIPEGWHEVARGPNARFIERDVPPIDPTAALRTALSRANLRELAEEAIEGGYTRMEVEPGLVLRMVAALATSQADDPSGPDAREQYDWRICRLHGKAQDDPTHDYTYPDCERAGYAEAAIRAEGLDVERLATAIERAYPLPLGWLVDGPPDRRQVAFAAQARSIAREYAALPTSPETPDA